MTILYNFLENDLKYVFAETYLATGIMVLLLFGVIYSKMAYYNFPIMLKPVLNLAILLLIITTLLILNNFDANNLIFQTQLYNTVFSNFFKILLLTSVIGVLLISVQYFEYEKINSFEYIILILTATLGLLFLLSSADLFTLYLSIELLSLSSYLLAAYKQNDNFSTEAGLKYFILGAFSSGILLLGCALIYGFVGTTNFADLYLILNTYSFAETDQFVLIGVGLGLLFISAAILFKLTAAPFHMWAPDVYEGSPTTVTAFFSIVPKIGLFGFGLKFYLYTFQTLNIIWSDLLLVSAVLSLLIGTLGALYQKRIKRLLAYSAIGHVGYLLLGVNTQTVEGIYSVILYLIIYISISINLFAVILALRTTNDNKKIKNIKDFSKIFKANPLLAFNLSIILFSIAGIPPLAGFYSKLYLFLGIIQKEAYFLAIFGILISVVGSLYYIKIIKLMLFDADENTIFLIPIAKTKAYVIVLTLLFNILFFLDPMPIMLTANNIAMSLTINYI